MKAKELAKFLMQHPEAEVITEQYLGDHFIVDINHAQLYTKGSSIEHSPRSFSNQVQDGKCKVDVIYIARESR